MQQLHILHYTFRFTNAQIVINCSLKYALVQCIELKKEEGTLLRSALGA